MWLNNVPWGIPYSTCNSSLVCSSITMLCILFDRYDLMRSGATNSYVVDYTQELSMIYGIKGLSRSK